MRLCGCVALYPLATTGHIDNLVVLQGPRQ